MGINDDRSTHTSALSLAEAQAEWDVERTFLDSCSYGPPPRRGWDAMQASLEQWRRGTRPWQAWADSVQTSRELFARMVGADADWVTTGAAVSQLLAPIAAALPDGAEVLVPDIEFTSGVYPFAVHADRGVHVRTAPLQSLAEAIDESTALVSFSAAQSATGEVADIPEITARAREVGALTVLDGTQAAGWLPLNAAEVDFLAVAAYKWLCAPRGAAFLTMRPPASRDAGEASTRAQEEFAARLKPLAAGWFAGGSGASFGMPMRLADNARAFDISPAWHSWVGMAPALELLLEVGVEAIHEHDVALANAFREGMGFEASNSAIVSIEVADSAPSRLEEAGIRFSMTDGRARFGFHIYNDQDDVTAAVEALRGLR
ncbi:MULTISPECIES: aminotransferase class V-fold PLP-dependent enzyme [Brevibacterium]|uniref:Aminotransferase class V-fold PLP-dependent enzyme n=1 Tax=Brevibacterium aurantiacum TaxID=273384 RepID=A0A2A3X1B0_BREAU|nr:MULTISPECIES: aminotransferase class V-fold PLP-dependent enzyme [Brevibacterium]MDN5594039.1 aminotransferase class V-fold PLP-dependent enzyme [Brevibacterium sp.]PCC17565.1 aminotransferase class V-fold PLP-dependent enzyme [Brevibacterium aurantiacum]PCC51280.1 aminotransferase class V-fold PLP-dependent enzyme [Brevibacterium aurantiacum]PCC57597.1 aminotransferase class V-fold PLP-dependent enzyme [Brevibacterium aurantiacum]SMX75611.1 Selenocysteine lyase/Cysteine desulfurase [Brevib